MLTIIEITRTNTAKRSHRLIPCRLFCASVLLSFCLSTQSIANSDFRSMPFMEMMVAMMKVMNHMMGNNNYVPGLGTLPYSPGMTMLPMASSLGGLNNFPMSPTGFPVNNFSDPFQTGQNALNLNNTTDFWNPKQFNQNSSNMMKNSYEPNTVNGIWQSLSGDVLAIYKNSYFLWTDGKRKLAGRLLFKGNNLVAYFPPSRKKLYFQFYKEQGQFVVRDKSSRIYTFKRLH